MCRSRYATEYHIITASHSFARQAEQESAHGDEPIFMNRYRPDDILRGLHCYYNTTRAVIGPVVQCAIRLFSKV